MKNKKLTITVGIPAYNEEANIGKLLKNILLQNANNFLLEKIVLISDGSTDKTTEEMRKIKSDKILFIENKTRKGLNATQNDILEITYSDILVILNGDVLPDGRYFLNNLIKPFYQNQKIGIVGARIKSIWHKSFVAKVLANSTELKEEIAKKINHGDNVYFCHGQARAFSKDLYKKILWPENCPEDSYSYFFCKEKGFKFFYANDAVVNFSMSTNINDHSKQNKRFIDGIRKLEKIFGRKEIKKSYGMPIRFSAYYLFIFLLKRPMLTTGYLSILLFVHFFSKNKYIDQSKFEISKSSKKIPL